MTVEVFVGRVAHATAGVSEGRPSIDVESTNVVGAAGAVLVAWRNRRTRMLNKLQVGAHAPRGLTLRRAVIMAMAFSLILPVVISSTASASGGHTGSCDIAGTQVATTIPESECEALEVIYNSLDGPRWPVLPWWTEWMTPVDPCTWVGVACSWPPTDKERHVAQLNLAGHGLRGEIPDDIAALTELWELNLDYNAINGEIPESLGTMAQLQQLRVANNHLEGELPASLGDLASIWRIDFGENNLEGELPPELAANPNMAFLYLDNNRLSGEIPPQIGDAANLRGLFINHNEFGGVIPSTITGATMLTQASIFSRSECYKADADAEKFLQPILGSWQIPWVFC